MKRILALILSLILCFGFVVSCSKEEEPTSEPTSNVPPASPKMPVSEDSSPKVNFTSEEAGIVRIDGRTLPVKHYVEDVYLKYQTTDIKSTSEYYSKNPVPTEDKWLFKNYAEYYSFVSENLNSVPYDITEQTFDSYFAFLVLINPMLEYSTFYGDLIQSETEGNYLLKLSTSRIEPAVERHELNAIDFVLIPKDKISAPYENISVDINLMTFKYGYRTRIVEPAEKALNYFSALSVPSDDYLRINAVSGSYYVSFSSVEDKYTTFTVPSAKAFKSDAYKYFDTSFTSQWLFKNYGDYSSFVDETLNSAPIEITEQTFENNFVFVAFFGTFLTENAFEFGDLVPRSEKVAFCFDKDGYLLELSLSKEGSGLSDLELTKHAYFVLIPKDKIPQEKQEKFSVALHLTEHIYE